MVGSLSRSLDDVVDGVIDDDHDVVDDDNYVAADDHEYDVFRLRVGRECFLEKILDDLDDIVDDDRDVVDDDNYVVYDDNDHIFVSQGWSGVFPGADIGWVAAAARASASIVN